MKKIFSLFTFICFCISINAQFVTSEELSQLLEKKYGKEKATDVAMEMAQTIQLTDEGELSFVKIVDIPNTNKNEIYVRVNQWFVNNFNNGDAVIQFNDKDNGTIIGRCHIPNISSHASMVNVYNVSIRPIIRVDIKDNKVRFFFHIKTYDIEQTQVNWGNASLNKTYNQEWFIDKTYPFIEKSNTKRTTSKALIMTCMYSDIVFDDFENEIKNGMDGLNEDW
jgi:hypothetical protein